MTHVHAGAVVVGEAGVLIRGVSGAGKSTLARRIVDAATRIGLFARLVGDDRIGVERVHDRVVLRPHRAILNEIEIRGLGIAATAAEEAAVLRLVVDCTTDAPPRLPATEMETTEIAGLHVRRIACRAEDEDRVLAALGCGAFTVWSR
jgi:HPr kinase/phosphorylase